MTEFYNFASNSPILTGFLVYIILEFTIQLIRLFRKDKTNPPALTRRKARKSI